MKFSQYTDLAKRLGYEWQNAELLLQAFCHTSWCNEQPSRCEPNERLEFLGDSVLDLLSAEFLMTKYPTEREGVLSQARAGIVKKQALAHKAAELGLGHLLLIGRGADALRTTEGVLADTMEALIGAAYADGGLAAARQVAMAAGVLH